MTRPQQLQWLVCRHSEAKWMQNTFERIATYAFKCVCFNGRNPNFSMTTKRVFFSSLPPYSTTNRRWRSLLYKSPWVTISFVYSSAQVSGPLVSYVMQFLYVIYHDNDVPNEYVTFLYVQMRWFPWLATVTEMLFPTLQYHTLPLEFAAVQVISSSARRHRSVF